MENYVYHVVYFFSDKDVQLINSKKTEIVGLNKDDGKVSVDYPTEYIEDDGSVVLKTKPYEGTVVFSGSEFYIFSSYFTQLYN